MGQKEIGRWGVEEMAQKKEIEIEKWKIGERERERGFEGEEAQRANGTSGKENKDKCARRQGNKGTRGGGKEETVRRLEDWGVREEGNWMKRRREVGRRR